MNNDTTSKRFRRINAVPTTSTTRPITALATTQEATPPRPSPPRPAPQKPTKPLVIVEVMGLPRSGKTSAIRALCGLWNDPSRILTSSDREMAAQITVPYTSWLWQVELARALHNTVQMARELHAKGAIDVLVLDRGFKDMYAWIECVGFQTSIDMLKHHGVNEWATLCQGFGAVNCVMSGVTVRDCQERHEKLRQRDPQEHNEAFDHVMRNDALLERLRQWYFRRDRDVTLSGSADPETNALAMCDEIVRRFPHLNQGAEDAHDTQPSLPMRSIVRSAR